jgi:ubiquinone/menaquinone biosynthesis C-methylase UbiE
MKTLNLMESTGVERVYRKRARHYDAAVRTFPLAGARVGRWRKVAVDALQLRPGNTVVEIGCGTGLNFPLIEKAIGPQGRLIGVDLTQAMLDEARGKIEGHSWNNVELVQSDAARYEFPAPIDAVISTFAITLIPAYDTVIKNAVRALRPGGRIVIMDFKLAENRLKPLVPLLERLLVRPFAGTREQAEQRHPWKSVERYAKNIEYHEFYGGFVYLSVGESPEASTPAS